MYVWDTFLAHPIEEHITSITQNCQQQSMQSELYFTLTFNLTFFRTKNSKKLWKYWIPMWN